MDKRVKGFFFTEVIEADVFSYPEGIRGNKVTWNENNFTYAYILTHISHNIYASEIVRAALDYVVSEAL